MSWLSNRPLRVAVAPVKVPTLILPVPLTIPLPNKILPPVMLPVALNCVKESKLVAASYPNAVEAVRTLGVWSDPAAATNTG